MKRTLIVTTRYPFYSQYGGRRRLESIAVSAAADGTVDLVCFAPGPRHERDVAAERALFRDVRFIPFRRAVALAGLVRSVFTGRAAQEGLYASGAMATWLQEHSAEYDVVVLHLLRAGQYLPNCRAPRRVLELTDAISRAHELESDASSGVRSLLNRYEARRCLAAEQRQALASDVAVLVSEVDRQYLQQRLAVPPERLVTVPLSVPDETFHVSYQPTRPSACFVGAMWFAPNVRGCEWLIEHVVPALRERVPGFQLEIIGAGPADVLTRLASAPGVVVHGFVPDLAAVTSGCIASFTPDLGGAGMQTKLVDSLAMGLPTLCTPLSARPLAGLVGGALRICATSEDFVTEFTALVESDALRREISERGRAAARAAFHETVIRDAYRAIL